MRRGGRETAGFLNWRAVPVGVERASSRPAEQRRSRGPGEPHEARSALGPRPYLGQIFFSTGRLTSVQRGTHARGPPVVGCALAFRLDGPVPDWAASSAEGRRKWAGGQAGSRLESRRVSIGSPTQPFGPLLPRTDLLFTSDGSSWDLLESALSPWPYPGQIFRGFFLERGRSRVKLAPHS